MALDLPHDDPRTMIGGDHPGRGAEADHGVTSTARTTVATAKAAPPNVAKGDRVGTLASMGETERQPRSPPPQGVHSGR